jgi:hypothetical protein
MQNSRQDFYHDQYKDLEDNWHPYYANTAAASALAGMTGMALGETAGLALGTSMAALPAEAVPVDVGGTTYYRAGGSYLQPQGGGYVVVPPPPGLTTASRPPGNCGTVWSGNNPYLDCGGVFYANNGNGYQVAAVPNGVDVLSLPPGAQPVHADGRTYYSYAGVYYRPVFGGSTLVYQTVPPPY